jgi:type II secretory pathway component GspD/PulD (secretin)
VLIRSHILLVVVLFTSTLALSLPTPASAQNDSPQPTAVELYEDGMAAFEAGKYKQARDLFRQLDPAQLPEKEQRVELFEALQAIDRQLHPEAAAEATEPADQPEPTTAQGGDAEPEPEPEPKAEADAEGEAEPQPEPRQWLARAREAADQDLGQAASLYQKILSSDRAGDALKRQAEAELAQVRRLQTPGRTQTRTLIDQAAEAIDRGDYETAQTKLDAIEQAEAELGWFDLQRVKRQQAIIRENTAPKLAERQPEPAEPTMPEQPAEPAPETEPSQPTEPEPAGPDTTAQAQPEPEQPAEPTTPEQSAEPAAKPDPTQQPPEDAFVQARRFYADKFAQQGDTAMDKDQYNVAVKRYEQALQFNSDDQQLQQRLEAARAARAQAEGEQGMLGQQAEITKARREAAIAEFEQAIAEAEQARKARNYGKAQDKITEAKLVLERNANRFGTDQYNRLDQRATELSARISEEQQTWQAVQQRRQEQQAKQKERQLRQQRESERYEEIQRLLKRAQRLRKDMKYDQALQLVDQALFIDETNIAAQAMKELIQQGQLMKRGREFKRQRELAAARQGVKNIEATTAYDGILNYPDDWPQISETRWQRAEDRTGESDVNRQVRQALNQSVPVDFDNVQLSTVIDYLRNTTDVNFFVNWAELEDAGVARDTLVSLQLTDVPASRALELVLTQAGARSIEPVDYGIIEGVVHVTSQRDLQTSTTTRVYDIRDLLVQVPSFSQAPQFDLRSALESSGSGQGGGGGGDFGGGGGDGGLFGGDEDEEEAEGPTREELIQEITTLIEDTVGGPDQQWGAGASSSLRELNGNLIVRTTSENHREVEQVLAQLRDIRAVQISVQARFLMVSDEFLEDMAVDFDVQINQSALSDNFGPIGIAQDSSTLAGPPVDPASNIASGAGGQGTGPYTPGVGFSPSGRALDLSASFVQSVEANLLVRATQVDRRSLELTAPRVTFFNGQRAFVIVARQESFVSDLEPVPDAIGFDPTLSVVQSGVVLDVEGTVSADRRYVTLTLRPSLAEVIDIEEFNISSISTTGFGSDDEGDLTAEPITSEQTLQQPELELTSVQATVSIPDKGTLLMGGQRVVDEFEREAGVPVLSKVPVLNRLFTNNSVVKDERTLLILVKPQIIIQNEEEDKRFPELQGMGPNQ